MDKLVFVKELSSGTTKGGKNYPIITDQDNDKWNIFFECPPFQVNKAYLFTFELNERGFKDIKAVKPLVNVFKERALKEVANRNDIVRNLSTWLSYAKDMAVAGILPLDNIYDKTLEMYQWVNNKADELMPKVEE